MKTKIRIVSQFCILALAVGAMSLAGATRAETTPTGEGSSLSAKDKIFMKKAAKGGMMEVAMGKMAEQNAQSDDVKSFGKRMVTDHGKANDELKSIASKKGFELPSKEHTLKWTSDKAYIDMMVKDHEKDLAEFKEEASSGSDPDLKKFADDTAKIVQEHLGRSERNPRQAEITEALTARRAHVHRGVSHFLFQEIVNDVTCP